MTLSGYNDLQKELKKLINEDRPNIIEAIAEARAHGDLKENAEYHAAKDEQAKTEGRIIKINDLIARANVIDVTKLEKKDNVIFGSTVDVIDLENNNKKTYKIVGEDEADITKNFIYYKSPIAKALIGKSKKEMVSFSTPSGEKNLQILEVKYI